MRERDESFNSEWGKGKTVKLLAQGQLRGWYTQTVYGLRSYLSASPDIF